MFEADQSSKSPVRTGLWIYGTVAVGIFGALSYFLFRRSLALSAEAIGANGLVLGVWGLVISVAGFAVTFWQLARTKSAAQAAATAVREVRSKVAAYDAIVEASRATSLIRETQRHLKVPSWDSAAASYGAAREALVRLIELPSTISAEERADLGATLADITSICDRIEAGLLKDRVNIDRGRALKASKDHEQLVMRIGITLQRQVV